MTDGHREVGVVADREVAPSALVVLGGDDELDGLAELFPELRAPGHPVALGQKQHREGVPVHRSAAGGRRVDDQSALLGAAQEVVDAPVDRGAVGAAARRVAGGQEGQSAKPANGHVAAVAACAEGAVVLVLPGGQECQPIADRLVGLRRNQPGCRRFRIWWLAQRGAEKQHEKQRQQARQPTGGTTTVIGSTW